MITRLLLAFALLVAGIVVAVVLITRSGNEKAAQTGSALSWERDPHIYSLASLPRDRVAIGRIVNSGSEPLTLSAGAFQLRDAEEQDVKSRVQFVDTRRRRPGSLKLGTDAELDPGDGSPLTISYRLEPGISEPITVMFEGAPALALPEGPLRPQTGAPG